MLDLPYDLRYSADHTWIREEDDDLLALGVTEAFFLVYGEPEDIELTATEGMSLETGDLLGRIINKAGEVEIYAPMPGQIIEFNVDLMDAPEVIVDSPYSQGWLVRIRPDEPEGLSALMAVEDYEGLIQDLKEPDPEEENPEDDLELDLEEDELELDEEERLEREEDY